MLKRNKPWLVIAFFLIVAAVLFGSIISLHMDSKTAEDLSKSFQASIKNGNNMDALLKSVSENGKILAIIWILGMTNIGTIPSLCIIAFRCFAIGYTSTYIINTFSLTGFLMTAASIFPHNFILISTFILLTIAANDTRKNKHEPFEKVFTPYNRIFILCVILTLTGCIGEAFISSSLMRLIAKIIA